MINRQTEKLDRQAAFDLMVEKLVAQGKLAREGGVCQYLTNEGTRCAVGWLLDDDTISEGLYGIVGNMFRKEGFRMDEDDVAFLRSAQGRLHDYITLGNFTAELLTQASAFAEDYGLTFDRSKFDGPRETERSDA